jgi:hypothetical protein
VSYFRRALFGFVLAAALAAVPVASGARASHTSHVTTTATATVVSNVLCATCWES